MIEELLKIIFEADRLIAQCQAQGQSENMQMMAAGVQDLMDIDEKIYQHFQQDIKR